MNDDQHFEYLLGELDYLNEEMFIVNKIKKHGVAFNVDQDVIKAYNIMHVWVQSASEMGDKWFEEETKTIDENV